MNDSTLQVAVCAECRGFVEPPYTPVRNLDGLPTQLFICQECREKILHPVTELPKSHRERK
jgi:hypothetical protein